MKNKKIRAGIAVVAVVGVVAAITVSVQTMSDKKEQNTESDNNVADTTGNVVDNEEEEESMESEIDPAYKLVWEDQFEGTELNPDDWNYEYHEPGWVNEEWQEYVDARENVYVKDGNLIIQPIKTTKDGKDYYTSGRINTQNKHDFKYGRFEMRGKVPSGKGFLPAFWMMPTDESFYGQWPKCGEIDIMEVLGDDTDKAYGTLHFGEPHTQKQGAYELETGNFSDEFHVFACEWEPGEMRFYIDNKLYFTENDWFTKRSGFDEVTYPAPYDQPFYMILNVAVGGTWVGYPDSYTEFGENAQLVVDYVRVYQKDEYDEKVQKPVKEIVAKEPDETGNYVVNGNFEKDEDLEDNVDWKFLLFGEGLAVTDISDQAIHIKTLNPGSLEYSVQLVQPNIPLENGSRYKLSFDAYADEERTIITNVTAPDLNYIRYLEDQKITLSTTSQPYEFEFNMFSDSDANGRVEFNMGAQDSFATVHITNVRVEKIGEADSVETLKNVLPDGNYIYNSSFQEGEDRMGYWTVENNCDGAEVFVTNDNLVRELKAVIPESVTEPEQVILKQSAVKIAGGKTYKFSLSAYAEEEKTITARIAGQTFDMEVGRQKQTYSFELKTEPGLQETELEILLGTAGTTYIDDVRIQEDGMIINGDFVNGMAGYEVYVHDSASTTYGVDELSEGGAMGFEISNTGDMDWKIQLMQKNIQLEKGKWYTVQFDAKSTKARKIKLEMQRDGASDNDWTAYSGTHIYDLTQDYQTFSCTFQMEGETDEKTILSFALGAVDNLPIKEKHTVYIDNISLEEVTAP